MKRTIMSLALLSLSVPASAMSECPEFLNFDLPRLHSNETVNICEVAAGKPLLVVNTASHCGFTKQFEGLEALHQQYKDAGLYVIGFASNDFNQEAADEAEVARVCQENFGVTFTMISPSFVKGARANPIFQAINAQSKEPGWNFNKYLLDGQGQVVEHFSSRVKPSDKKLTSAIEAVLP